MSTPAATKKRKASVSGDEDDRGAAEAAGKPISATHANGTMDLRILNLALAWFDPNDLGLCSQVCHLWRSGITQHSWKEAAENAQPEAFQALETAMKKRKGKQVSYQAIAVGLTKNSLGDPSPQIPQPTLKPEDIFLLVEVDMFGTNGAWCTSLSKSMENFDPTEFMTVKFGDVLAETPVTEFQIPPCSEEESDWNDYANFLRINLGGTLSLWRADTGQTICLTTRTDTRSPNDYAEHLDKCEEEEEFKFSFGYTFMTDIQSPEGTVAKCLSKRNDYYYLLPNVNVCLEPELPPAGCNGEPDWLKEARATRLDEDVGFRDDMQAYLAKGDSKCRVSCLEVEMWFSVGDDPDGLEEGGHNVQSRRDFLLFLEGLGWK